MKRLFIPLKREYFEAFEKGTKREEYRPLGPRWNAETCFIGRRVVLSLGYGKARRLDAVVTSFRVEPQPVNLPGWVECYGSKHDLAACIGITLATTIPMPEYPCTECSGDAYVGMANWWEGGRQIIGAEERLCMRCCKKRGIGNPFQHQTRRKEGRA